MCKGNFVRKTWFELFAAGIVMFTCISCNDAKLEHIKNETTSGTELTVRTPGELSDMLEVQYIRTGYDGDINYPVVTVVADKKELKQYLETSSAYACEPGISEFSTEFKNYPDDFFANNFLVIVLLAEGSGSIKHKVESINEKGDILISRLVPEMGTDDMAAWNIVIELDNSCRFERFEVTFSDKKL